MPIERTRQWLSNELLKNAEFLVRQIEEGRHNEEGLMRMICHAYYYSIHHKCRSLMPSLDSSAQKGVHSATRKKLEAKDKYASILYGNLQALRISSDYEAGELTIDGEPLNVRVVSSIYYKLNEILDKLNWEQDAFASRGKSVGSANDGSK
jgi:hypothetical protein